MWDYNQTTPSNELYHYGIKGMKWGVRRYQNKDGTLTNKGKKHYSNISNDKLAKELKKQVRSKRSELHGSSNRWAQGMYIGENSKKAIDKSKKDLYDYINSKDIKEKTSRLKKLDVLMEQNPSKYEKEYNKLSSEVYNPKFDSSKRYTNTGKKMVKEYIDSYGKNITLGYIKDLGYDNKTSQEFADRVLKSKTIVIE